MHYIPYLGSRAEANATKLYCGLYYEHITIVNDNFIVVRMLLQVVASPTIVILMTLEVSFMLLENI